MCSEPSVLELPPILKDYEGRLWKLVYSRTVKYDDDEGDGPHTAVPHGNYTFVSYKRMPK